MKKVQEEDIVSCPFNEAISNQVFNNDYRE